MSGFDLKYEPDGEQLRQFLLSKKRVSAICGPIGSGKSTASCIKAFINMNKQEPGPDGIRRSKGAVIRNTFPQLRTTTAPTWLMTFPEEIYGRFRWSPPFCHTMKWNDCEAEIWFLALDRPEHVSNLLSLELTWAWINEAREVQKEIIDMVDGRINRFPPMRDGGATYPELIMDTNMPGATHWWPIMAGMVKPPEWMSEADKRLLVKPDNWAFFTQPPAVFKYGEGANVKYELNPNAENLKWLADDYYSGQMQGKREEWVDNYLGQKLRGVQGGKAVYAKQFRRSLHVSEKPIPRVDSAELLIGIDLSGLTIGAVYGQFVGRQLQIIAEQLEENVSNAQWATRQKQKMSEIGIGDIGYRGWADPVAGHGQAGDDEARSSLEILEGHELFFDPAPTNDPTTRRDGLAELLQRLDEGVPAIVVSCDCQYLVEGLEGAYHYAKKRGSQHEYKDKPEKNDHSHVVESLEYLVLGFMLGKHVLRARKGGGKPSKAKIKWNVWGRKRKRSAML